MFLFCYVVAHVIITQVCEFLFNYRILLFDHEQIRACIRGVDANYWDGHSV